MIEPNLAGYPPPPLCCLHASPSERHPSCDLWVQGMWIEKLKAEDEEIKKGSSNQVPEDTVRKLAAPEK